MATADPRNVLRVIGRLVANPTNLATAFPHGGTELGLATAVSFQPRLQAREIRAEEFGGETIEVVQGAQRAILGVIVRGWDSDMITTIFEDAAVGASTNRPVVTHPGTVRSGALASSRSLSLLYSPRDTEAHPAIILYRALPLLEETADLQLSLGKEMGIAAMFIGIRDASGKLYQMGPLEDLTSP